MYAVRGVLKGYDWGVVDGLSRWSGAADGSPQAELWFGAHPSGPSPLVDSSGTLADVMADAPLLVKLLCADHPLSIQVHPDAQTAASGRFTDLAEKTELLWALERFEAFAGWRDSGQAADALLAYGVSPHIVRLLREGHHAAALPLLLREGAVDDSRLLESCRAAGIGEAACDAVGRAAWSFPHDPGLLALVLLDHVILDPGDALFVPAGVVHAYVRGLGLEVMTSSDNVIRLGLTSKPVSVDVAVAALREDRAPVVARQQAIVRPDGAPFAVERVPQSGAVASTGAYRLILAVDPVDVVVGGCRSSLAAGTAMVLDADAPQAMVDGGPQAYVVRASEAR